MQLNESAKKQKILSYLENARAKGLPKDAYLQICYACNGRCVMCEIWKSKTFGESGMLKKIISRLAELDFDWVTLWGGEPLMHPEITLLMQQVKRTGMKLQIITNGSFLEKNLEAVCANVDNLVVSLDSGIPAVHDNIRGRKGMYMDTVRGLELVLSREHRPNVELDCTILNENLDTLTSIVELSKCLGGIFIDFDPAQIQGVGNNQSYKLKLKPEQIDHGIDCAVELASAYGIEITSRERIKLIKKYLKNEKIVEPCYSYCKDLLVNPEGKAHTCWAISEIVGNVLDKNFESKWRDALAKNAGMLTGEKDECQSCGFSHSRLPDAGYAEIIKEANAIRLSNIGI